MNRRNILDICENRGVKNGNFFRDRRRWREKRKRNRTNTRLKHKEMCSGILSSDSILVVKLKLIRYLQRFANERA